MPVSHPVRSPVLLVTVAALAVLGGAVVISPADVAREHGILEWAQVALLAATVLVALVSATRAPAAIDVLVALAAAAAIRAEIDLDRWVFGIPIVDTRFLTRSGAPVAARLAAGLVIAGIAVATALYAVRRRVELRGELRGLFGRPWGRTLLAATALLATAQLFERQLAVIERTLAAVVPIPRWFLEESIELMGAAYCLLAVVQRVVAKRRAPSRDARRRSPIR